MPLGHGEDGEYAITVTNMYARRILFGEMIIELGDAAKHATCFLELRNIRWAPRIRCVILPPTQHFFIHPGHCVCAGFQGTCKRPSLLYQRGYDPALHL
ncbi:hypothetical protein EI94DRAFT_1751840, partial [Lactarius quietus]